MLGNARCEQVTEWRLVQYGKICISLARDTSRKCGTTTKETTEGEPPQRALYYLRNTRKGRFLKDHTNYMSLWQDSWNPHYEEEFKRLSMYFQEDSKSKWIIQFEFHSTYFSTDVKRVVCTPSQETSVETNLIFLTANDFFFSYKIIVYNKHPYYVLI